MTGSSRFGVPLESIGRIADVVHIELRISKSAFLLL